MIRSLSLALFATGLLMAGQCSGQSVLVARMQELFRSRQLVQYDSFPGSYMVHVPQSGLMAKDSGLMVYGNAGTRFQVSVLPVTLTLQHNAQLPYEWNLGAMVRAKGFQVHGAAGVRLSLAKGLALQLAPEWVSAQNLPFETMSQELNPRMWRDYFVHYYNITDIPERMGDKKYRRFYPGQSYLRYEKGGFRYALSTESKWWGPGYRNALVLSNNAPGFFHFSMASRKPLPTRWGSLEGELIGGILAESGVLPPRAFTAYDGQFVFPNKNNANRYLTGFTLNWQPRWVRGLYLGFSKASFLYPSDIRSPLDVLPLQGLLGNKATRSEKEGTKASLGSFFMRLVLPEEKAEIYWEYGRADRAIMPWNMVSSSPRRNGYVAGLRKMIPVGVKGTHIQIVGELTQLQAHDTLLVLEPGSWYTHNKVLQGYTHMGRALGAGIGPGSNSQMLEVNWIRHHNRIGLQFERVRHNGDYYYATMPALGDYRRHWVTLATTLKADWDLGPVDLHGSLGMVRSLNHQWIVVEARGDNYFSAGNEYLNIAGQLSVRYRF